MLLHDRAADGDQQPESLSQIIDAKGAWWEQLWCPDGVDVFDAYAAVPSDQRQLPGPLPNVEQFRSLLRTYRWRTAVGSDRWQPRSLGLLPDAAYEALLGVIRGMLLTGRIPSQMSLLLIGLIPKSDSGERPIGIFPTTL